MERESLSTLSDAEVVGRLKALLGEERRVTAAVLLHLAEVEARELHLRAAFSSMHGYCVRVLGMSEDEAFKRIRAARAVRRFPAVERAVAEGRLHLSAVVLLAPHLTENSADELVAEASGKSKAEIEVVLARRAPRPDVAARLEPVAEQIELVSEPPLGPEPPGRDGAARARVAPLSPERFALQLTIPEATRAKLVRAQALLRHRVPSGDLAEVVDHALDALLDQLERTRFGKRKAEGPRESRAARKTEARGAGARRYVPRAVTRRVIARDGDRCSFVSEDGRRCEEIGFLELDHVVPVSRGGEASAEGVRILCRAHNQFEARRILGREAVDAGRAAREAEAELVAGLRRLGVTAKDAREAVATSGASKAPGPVADRMRAALAALHTIYTARERGTRCSEPRRVRWRRRVRWGRREGGAEVVVAEAAGQSGSRMRRMPPEVRCISWSPVEVWLPMAHR